MVLLLINVLFVVAALACFRWKTNREVKSTCVGGLVLMLLPLLMLDCGLEYKEIRRDPAKMLQVEWEGAKYEGYSPEGLKKVESFTPPPHTRPVYANFFGFELK